MVTSFGRAMVHLLRYKRTTDFPPGCRLLAHSLDAFYNLIDTRTGFAVLVLRHVLLGADVKAPLSARWIYFGLSSSGTRTVFAPCGFCNNAAAMHAPGFSGHLLLRVLPGTSPPTVTLTQVRLRDSPLRFIPYYFLRRSACVYLPSFSSWVGYTLPRSLTRSLLTAHTTFRCAS